MYNNQVNQPPAPALSATDLSRLQAILEKFEVSIADAQDLVALEDYKIVMVCDDSGSMQRSAVPASMRRLGEAQLTRWQELQSTASLIVDIACCFDKEGVDTYFLNRKKIPKVTGPDDKRFVFAFRDPPQGSTPLTRVVNEAVNECAGERPVLMIVLTDGEPDGGARPFIRMVRDVVSKSSTSAKVKFQIMACTPEEDEVEWLNRLDYELKEVDVTDDYHTEKRQVIKAGKRPVFTRGDWCMKAMLGPISTKFDSWDEMPKGRTMFLEDQCRCSGHGALDQCSIQ
mmetsp:Transcript_35634/g.65302  ORF Transcript_35634/g.65302 Transcript_35634/m.65302 type:complete len:285 (-) Transcript_35634:96-950(-)